MAVTVEKDIAVQVKTESDRQKELLAKFEEKLKEYFTKMKKQNIHQYATGSVEALKTLDSMKDEITGFEKDL